MFRPTAVFVKYTNILVLAVDGWKGTWVVDQVQVQGPTVLKNGDLSKVTTGDMHWYGQLGLPGWLTDLVRENTPKEF